ncbi:MAG TPA: hypothetical protein VGH16_09860 [Candidatus Binatia bacterium]|jgi:hypothetical protein
MNISPEYWVDLSYGVLFLLFTIFTGSFINRKGRAFLADAFAASPTTGEALASLLNIGFYIICAGLLLWTIGTGPHGTVIYHQGPTGTQTETVFLVGDSIRKVFFLVGLSIFVVGIIHLINILAVAILSRKRSPD